MARKKSKPYKVDAAYTAEGIAICPVCWSRPSVDGRSARNAEVRSRGWSGTVVEKTVRHDGLTYNSVVQLKYPCSNSDCLAQPVVEWRGNMMGVEGHAHLFATHRLKEKDQAKYESGHTDKFGVWRVGPAPEVEVKVKRRRKKEGEWVKKGQLTPELPEDKVEEPKKTRKKKEQAAPKEKKVKRTEKAPKTGKVAKKPKSAKGKKATPKPTKRKKA